MSFNHITIIGRITKDISLQYSTSGTAYIRNSIAVDRKGKEKKTDFFSITAFGKTAEFIDKYFSKGSKIVIEGEWRTGSYTNKDGQKVYTTDVVVEEQEFCESKASDQPKEQDNGFVKVPEGIEQDLPFK